MQILVEESELPTAIQLNRAMSDDEYFEFCAENRDKRIERTAQGDIIIMPPAGVESSFRNNEISAELRDWARKDGRGRAFDSSAEFILPSGAAYSPDAAWISSARLNKLTKAQKRKFAPLCPEFVIELMSPSDRLSKAKAKMREWIENGAELAWLLDPDHRTAYIYRPDREPEMLIDPKSLTGEGPVAGFVLDLESIWAGL
jgi:Uma2 family endonuclease